MKKIFLLLLVFTFLFQQKIAATLPYQSRVTVGNQSTTFGATSILDLIRELRTTSIDRKIIYTGTEAAALRLNLRGLLAIGSYPQNSTTLTIQIPQAGIVASFTGSTREESNELFEQFLKNNGNNNRRLLKAYAKFTSIDPIAGNPNSLLSQMGQYDYLLGRLSPLSGCDCCWSAQPIVHQFQAGANLGRALSSGFDTTIVTLPLRYSYSPDYSHAFIFDAPLTILYNGGAFSAVGSLALGWRMPLTERWSLTPTFRFGAGGSLDLCTAGCFVSPGISSTYNYPLYNYVLSMTNFVGYYASIPLHLGGINFDYRLYNFAFKNGVNFSSCEGYEICGRAVTFNVSFIDSAFTGSSLFIEHYDEVGINLVTTHVNPNIDYDCLSLGFSYQFGQEDYKGYFLNLTYQF